MRAPPTTYRGTVPIGNSALLGPYSRTMHTALWKPQGGGLFLMSEVPLWCEGVIRCRGKREQPQRFGALLPGRQSHNVALTVLHVPHSLDSSCFSTCCLTKRPRARESSHDISPFTFTNHSSLAHTHSPSLSHTLLLSPSRPPSLPFPISLGSSPFALLALALALYRGTSLIRSSPPPPRATIGPLT